MAPKEPALNKRPHNTVGICWCGYINGALAKAMNGDAVKVGVYKR